MFCGKKTSIRFSLLLINNNERGLKKIFEQYSKELGIQLERKRVLKARLLSNIKQELKMNGIGANDERIN